MSLGDILTDTEKKIDDNHVVIILDSSGSMYTRRSEVVTGYNEFIDAQKRLPGNVFVTLVTFNTVSEFVYEYMPISRVPDMTMEEFVCEGGTALLDVVGNVVSMLRDNNEEITTVLIITDGEENSSSTRTKEEVQGLVKSAAERGVVFIYIGADVDNFDVQGAMLGIASSNVTYRMPDGRQEIYTSISGTAGGQSVHTAFTTASNRMTASRTAVDRSTV